MSDPNDIHSSHKRNVHPIASNEFINPQHSESQHEPSKINLKSNLSQVTLKTFQEKDELHGDKPSYITSNLKKKIFTKKNEQQQIQEVMSRLRQTCFITTRDRHKQHEYRSNGLKIIKYIISKFSADKLSYLHMVHILWGYLTCIHHFQTRLILKSGIISWSRQKKFNRVAKFLDDLLKYFPKGSHVIIVSAVMTFFKVGKLWENEQVCHLVLGRTMTFTMNIEDSLLFIINTAEELSLSDSSQARDVIQILYQLLQFMKFQDLSEAFMTKLMYMYQLSIDTSPRDKFKYGYLKEGVQYSLKVCIKYFPKQRKSKLLELILDIVDKQNLSENGIINFGLLAEMAAFRLMYDSPLLSIPKKMLTLCFKFIISHCVYKSLLGLVVYQNLWDRFVNRPYFSTPVIFKDEGNYHLTFGSYTPQSKNYFNNDLKDAFQNCFLDCLRHNCNNKIVLEHIFTCIALNLCDLPCGVVASSAACLAMKIQEYSLSARDSLSYEHQFHLHAMVVSILSLICYIFQADELHDYINRIIHKRAMFGPHLLPPLRPTYEYAPHHILYNYGDFYVEDWELRYGLWKCFREHQIVNIREKKNTNFPNNA